IGPYYCDLYSWNYMPIAQLQGPTSGIIGEELTFSITATDPDNDSISIRIDWGDNEFTEWTELQPSGSTFEASHSYSQYGEYAIKVQIADQWYFLNELCHNSISEWSEPFVVNISDSTSTNPILNDSTPMISIYPNPFRNSTTISFSSLQVGPARSEITVFNIKGQVIRTWSLNQTTHKVVWNGKDSNGKKLANGIYFCKHRIGGLSSTKKIILLK
ncbi:MAG: T9SS type A sorting domain-containing protein, partial [Mariniphaga sp.]|nr:T9SS type A sorting domain-containing protein [Mariniphaga sp.]